MSTIYLLKYNNYYNRLVKKYDTIQEYAAYILQSKTGVNFNPNDGVNTELVFNGIGTLLGDYLISVNSDSKAIESRWFIMDSVRLCAKQYRLILRRDLLADYYDSVIDSPCFIEKATLKDTDPFIFNSENMTFDQIKTSETLLKDKSRGAWVVGYIPRDFPENDEGTSEARTIEFGGVNDIGGELEATTGIENFTYNGVTLWDYTEDGGKQFCQTIDLDKMAIGVATNTSVGAVLTSSSQTTIKTETKQLNTWFTSDGSIADYSSRVEYDFNFGAAYGRFSGVLGDSNALPMFGNSDTPFAVSSSLASYKYRAARHSTISYADVDIDADYWKPADAVTYDETLYSDIKAAFESYYDNQVYDVIQEVAAKGVKDTLSGISYEVKIEIADYLDDDTLVPESGSTIDQALVAYVTASGNITSSSDSSNGNVAYRFLESIPLYKVTLTPRTNVKYSVTIPANTARNYLADSPFDMFCMPYGEETLLRIISSEAAAAITDTAFQGNSQLSQSAAIAIGSETGVGNVYDLQLLPYCPVQQLIRPDGSLDITNIAYTPIKAQSYEQAQTIEYIGMEQGAEFVAYRENRTVYIPYSGITVPASPDPIEVIAGGTTPNGYQYLSIKTSYANTAGSLGEHDVGAMIWCNSSSFSFQIPLDDPIVIEDAKIESQTDMYRLVSPNYSGQFEFNAAENGGVKYFDVYCTYKPYNPYISVRPNFGRLYGRNFADGRGLICGGDFSLPQVSDPWAEYEYSNKNYENIFNRQIENMEVNNSIARTQELFGIGTGAIQGATSGAMTGLMMSGGNPIGAVVGGVVGGASSLAGGIVDYSQSERLRNETLDYSKDMYGYTLGNIKAQSQSLTKASALTINNKLFPFLEYYTCPQEQKTALENKLKYNGMTVMRIGTIAEFLQDEMSYIKGQLIRLVSDSTDIDYHIVNEIASEIYKGAYI